MRYGDSCTGETFWAASDIGWVVGHSYIAYAPLLHGCTTILYEGKPVTPDAGIYWRTVEERRVVVRVRLVFWAQQWGPGPCVRWQLCPWWAMLHWPLHSGAQGNG